MANWAIEVDAVSRSYGRGRDRVDALTDVSFAVEAGTVTALLGENGAGKTTMTKILATLLLPSSGHAQLLGHDVATEPGACRRLASVVFGGERGLYPQLNARDNLRFFGMLAGVTRRDAKARIPGLLEQVGLTEAGDRRVETYSKGMKQRLHIALGFLPRPRVMLLDEPTVGLDPLEADRLRGAIATARDDGVTVLLTSHNLVDVERLADRVLLLDRGVVTEDLPLPEFVQRAGYAAAVTIRGLGSPPSGESVTSDRISPVGPAVVTSAGWELTVRVLDWNAGVFGALSTMLAGCDVVDVVVREVRLDEAFAHVAGQTS